MSSGEPLADLGYPCDICRKENRRIRATRAELPIPLRCRVVRVRIQYRALLMNSRPVKRRSAPNHGLLQASTLLPDGEQTSLSNQDSGPFLDTPDHRGRVES